MQHADIYLMNTLIILYRQCRTDVIQVKCFLFLLFLCQWKIIVKSYF